MMRILTQMIIKLRLKCADVCRMAARYRIFVIAMRGLFIFMMYGAEKTGNPKYFSFIAAPIFIYNNRLVSGFTSKQ